MTPLERRRFELHAETDGYRRRIDRAIGYVDRCFDSYAPYLSVSGGKDSTVLHHLTTQVCGHDDVDVFHFDWGLRDVPGAKEHVNALVDQLGGNLFYRTSDGVTDPEKFANDEHHGIEGIFGWVTRLAKKRGWDCALLGIRGEESPARRDRYAGTPPTHHNGVQLTAAPIHHLVTADVWAYLVEHDLPYHDIYDEQGKLFGGIDHARNRLVTVYDHEFSSLGSEAISQFLYPEKTNELKDIEQRKAND